MSALATRTFWIDAADRAVRTLAQSLVATLAVGTGLLDVSWVAALSTSGLAAALSLLTSVATSGAGATGTAALVDSSPGRHAAPPE